MLGALDRPTPGHFLYRGSRRLIIPIQPATGLTKSDSFFSPFTFCPRLPPPKMSRSQCSRPTAQFRAQRALDRIAEARWPRSSPRSLSIQTVRRRAPARRYCPQSGQWPVLCPADEPTGNLDSENAHLVLDLIIRLQQEQGSTLVLVTHDPSIAERASRTLHMKDGRIVSDKSAASS